MPSQATPSRAMPNRVMLSRVGRNEDGKNGGSTMSKSIRPQSGSIFILTILVTFFVIMPLLMVLGNIGVYLIDRDRVQTVVEAAGLLAANDVSRLVINDGNFGYVSLSNYPPTGQATRAPDGESLPVIGINTLVGTLRQNAIIARELRNQTISSLVDADRSNLERTIQQLNTSLSDCLNGSTSGNLCDIQGETVDPVHDVTDFLTSRLPKDVELRSVKLSNGWLTGGSTTAIPIPLPQRLALLSDQDIVGDTYKAFVDLPVGKCSFSFAGLGSSASLVTPFEFQEADSDHICSIVKVECTFVLKNLPLMPFGINALSELRCVACCQPYALPDVATKGAMDLRLSNGLIAGFQSWRDFLKKENFSDHQVTLYDVSGGDYPVDQEAHMNQIPNDSQLTGRAQPGTAQQFAEHLYYWLRNGHLRPQLGSVLEMINDPFQNSTSFTYEFADNGKITRKMGSNDPLPTGVVSDNQVTSVADTNLACGLSPVIIFRDNVKYLGTKQGGKHAGQPLPYYRPSQYDCQRCGDLNTLFPKLEKRSIYGRGLALDIEFGGPRQATPEGDIVSMRKAQQTRRI